MKARTTALVTLVAMSFFLGCGGEATAPEEQEEVSPTYLFAGTNNSLRRSTDNGRTWEVVGLTGTTVYSLAVSDTD